MYIYRCTVYINIWLISVCFVISKYIIFSFITMHGVDMFTHTPSQSFEPVKSIILWFTYRIGLPYFYHLFLNTGNVFFIVFHYQNLPCVLMALWPFLGWIDLKNIRINCHRKKGRTFFSSDPPSIFNWYANYSGVHIFIPENSVMEKPCSNEY